MAKCELLTFANKWLGKPCDYDGFYGAQCVDLFRQYCAECVDTPHTGSVSGARELGVKYDYNPTLQKYFEKITDPRLISAGDVIVNTQATTANPHGHVCIAVADVDAGGKVLVIQQNGLDKNTVVHLAKFQCNEYTVALRRR